MNKQIIKIVSVLITLLIFLSSATIAQTPVSYKQGNANNLDQIIDVVDFNTMLMQNVILIELNKLRRNQGLDKFTPEQILTLSAKELAGEMADKGYYKIENPDKIKNIVREQGGTGHVTEVVYKLSIKKGAEYFSYKTVAQTLISKLETRKKSFNKIASDKYLFIGIGCSLDEAGKKLYISAILGNYFSFNNGSELVEEFSVELTTKSMGLRPRNERKCAKIDKYNLNKFQKDLVIEDDIIYLRTNNLKYLKKIIKKDSKDGLAVDILLKDQYPCDGANIIDFEVNSRGVMTKPKYANAIYNNNEYEKPESKRKLKVELGELPLDIGNNYELNLVVIKDGYFCKSVPQAYLLDGGFKPFKKIRILADTVTINSKLNFIPETAEDEFNFRFPLEKGRSTYTYDEIKPHIDEFNAPPFVIKSAFIALFSSIEMSGNRDMIKCHKKGENIAKSLGESQEEKLEVDIITSNSWSIFRNEVLGTEYENLAFMGFDEALRHIKRNKLTEELEPIFAKNRFAQIQLNVVYDLRGEKEQEYVLHLFNKSVENGKMPIALSIQKYIFKMIISGKYNNNAIINQRIPIESKFTGLLMNKLWLQSKVELIDDELLYKSLQELNKLSPNNPYIHFSLLVKSIDYKSVGDDYDIYKTQTEIDNLYKSTIGKKTIDALNLEYQFKVITALDTLDKPSPKIMESLDNIKSIYNINSISWKNSLQLAHLFINHGDYKFAIRLLDVFVEDTNVNEDLLFTYLSLCTVIDNKYYTTKFESALIKASVLNKKRFCKLFNGSKFSLRVFENPNVKKHYCTTCGK